MLRERLAQREQRIVALKSELAAANPRTAEAGRADARRGNVLLPLRRSSDSHAAPPLQPRPQAAAEETQSAASKYDVPASDCMLDTAATQARRLSSSSDSTMLLPIQAAAAPDATTRMAAGPAASQEGSAAAGQQAAEAAAMVTNPLALQEAEEAFPLAAAAPDDSAAVQELRDDLADVRLVLARREADLEALQAALLEAVDGHAQVFILLLVSP